VIGADIIGEHQSELLQQARLIALTHHEKWDGSGYPHGITGADIPLIGRIVAIADVFDALTSVRPYKPAWTVADATLEIVRQSGRHFDPELVVIFQRLLPELVEIHERYSERNWLVGDEALVE